MPFDGGQPCLEIQVIDMALEVLGPRGENWIQHRNSDYRGGRCVVGAVRYAQRKLGIKGDSTIQILYRAIYISAPKLPMVKMIEAYNDGPWRKFDEVAGVLVHARNLAANRC